MGNRTYSLPRALDAMDRMRKLMAVKQRSAHELAEALHLEISGIHQYLKHMLAQTLRQIHVAAYKSNRGGRPTPLYALGDKPDAPKPRTPTVAERMARRRATAELAEKINRQQRQHYMLRQAKAKKNTIFGALGL